MLLSNERYIQFGEKHMRYAVVVKVLVGLVGMLIVGCGSFGADPPEKTRNEYSKFVEDKMVQLRATHEKFVVEVQQSEVKPKRQTTLEAALDDLTKRRDAVQHQVDALQEAKGQEWFVLQYGMNAALEELSQSYSRAFALNAV